jgi:hypothetical protein
LESLRSSRQLAPFASPLSPFATESALELCLPPSTILSMANFHLIRAGKFRLIRRHEVEAWKLRTGANSTSDGTVQN